MLTLKAEDDEDADDWGCFWTGTVEQRRETPYRTARQKPNPELKHDLITKAMSQRFNKGTKKLLVTEGRPNTQKSMHRHEMCLDAHFYISIFKSGY